MLFKIKKLILSGAVRLGIDRISKMCMLCTHYCMFVLFNFGQVNALEIKYNYVDKACFSKVCGVNDFNALIRLCENWLYYICDDMRQAT